MRGLAEIIRRYGWIIPPGYEPKSAKVCRRCTHEVLWCLSGTRWMLVDPDGNVHPWDCRKRKRTITAPEPDRLCPYCRNEHALFTETDLELHVVARHPIARTLPLDG